MQTPRRMVVDFEAGWISVTDGDRETRYPVFSPNAYAAMSEAWLRIGWELKHSYTFTWLGRPIIQLPEDLIRVQEAVFRIQPDVIVETGVAHGGSLIFYATLCRALGRGRVVGVDVRIRPENRMAIEAHPLADLITLIEGSSIEPAVVRRVRESVAPGERALVVLDSNHTRAHVLAELDAYADLVAPGSYVAVADGLMSGLADSPRAGRDWATDNPLAAVHEFLARRADFVQEPPAWPFNESLGLESSRATYFPGGWLRRVEHGSR
jgi:cephalosporin hydroxylase